MKSIEKAFAEYDNILDRAGMPTTGYVNQTEKIQQVIDGMFILNNYTGFTYYQLYNELDHPLYVGFANGATQELGKIELNSITTENTFHMEEHYIVDGCDYTLYSKRIKAELTLEDFMGLVDVEAGEGMPTLEHVEIVGTFAELFRKEYERMNPADTDINTYLKAVQGDTSSRMNWGM